MPRDVGAVVVAAGQGVRLGGEPKQFRPVAGVPMLLRALRPFLSHPEIDQVVAVLPAASVEDPPDWLAPLAGERLRLVAGGATRTASVRAGLGVLEEEIRTVLIHDGARPFPATAVIDGVIAAARAGRGAVAAIPVTDTLKEVEPGSMVIRRTVPRDRLWRAQTPQGFPRDLLARAQAMGEESTDDAGLVERLGGEVVVVQDVITNLKVTTAEDLALAEAIARAAAPPS